MSGGLAYLYFLCKKGLIMDFSFHDTKVLAKLRVSLKYMLVKAVYAFEVFFPFVSKSYG